MLVVDWGGVLITNLIGLAGFANYPLVEDGNMVGHGFDFVEQVAGEEDRTPGRAKRQDDIPDLATTDRQKP